IDRRTNRDLRWKLASDHPDYSSEDDARLTLLRLLIDLLRMRNAPQIDRDFLISLSTKYFGRRSSDGNITDPLTEEPLDYSELVHDVVTKPKHGYSKFHIGHQDPRYHPKHTPNNVRWQLKSSNDFQQKMDIRVARIAFKIDQFTRAPAGHLLKEA